jgi:hypothetical protein
MVEYPSLAEVEQAMASNRYRHSQNFRGAGFLFLQQQLLSEEMNDIEKDLLRRILKDHRVDPLNDTGLTGPPPVKKPKTLKTIDSNMSDETILQYAKQVPSSMSLLASLLKVVDDDGGNVTAKAFLKTCALAVRPGMVPPMMDAKEMVLAALQFLSETTTWIRPVQEQVDLEKRSYTKVGDWKLADILPQVAELESVFYEGGADLIWMPRTRFVPPMQNPVEEDLLLLKGNPPAGYSAKKVVRKKKVTSSISEEQRIEEADP